jgi:hypothetical protein
MRRLFAALAAGSLVLGLSGVPAVAGTAPLTPPCVNDTLLPNNFGNSTGLSGNPNIGLRAATSTTLGGYYYLDLTACATTVTFTVYTPGCWHFEFFNGIDHSFPRITHFNNMDDTKGFTYTYTQAVVGQIYAARFANMSLVVVTDHSHISSP